MKASRLAKELRAASNAALDLHAETVSSGNVEGEIWAVEIKDQLLLLLKRVLKGPPKAAVT
jgi:hypothetical protein